LRSKKELQEGIFFSGNDLKSYDLRDRLRRIVKATGLDFACDVQKHAPARFIKPEKRKP
jgi:hypothetical protein